VVADWTAAETTKQLSEKAGSLEKRVKSGETLDAIASELKIEKQTKRGVKRDAEDADFGRDGAAATFDVGEGGVGLFPAPTGDAEILFKVVEAIEPAGADASSVPEGQQKAIATSISNDLLDQLVAQLQTQYKIQIDQVAISQALTR
jgi:peptidyl-prolyl cis-trans isomerase D